MSFRTVWSTERVPQGYGWWGRKRRKRKRKGEERENVHLSETKQNFCIDLILRVGMWSLGSTSIEFIFSPWF